MIYFAQIGETGPVKIGTTIQLVQRLLQLKATKGGRLRILAIADGGRDMEIHHHKTFRHLHIKGEWFRPGEDLLGHIALYRRDNERAGIFTGTPVTFVRRKVEGALVKYSLLHFYRDVCPIIDRTVVSVGSETGPR